MQISLLGYADHLQLGHRLSHFMNEYMNKQINYTGLCQIPWFLICTELAVTASSSALWTGSVRTASKLIKSPVIHPLLNCAFTVPLASLRPCLTTASVR